MSDRIKTPNEIIGEFTKIVAKRYYEDDPVRYKRIANKNLGKDTMSIMKIADSSKKISAREKEFLNFFIHSEVTSNNINDFLSKTHIVIKTLDKVFELTKEYEEEKFDI